MAILINPYNGNDDRITALIKNLNGTPQNIPECKGSACPIRKPIKLVSALEITKNVKKILAEQEDVKEIVLPALNQKDAEKLQNLIKEWRKIGPSVVFNIALVK